MIQGRESHSLLTKTEKVVIAGLLGTVGVFTILDVYEDWHEGASARHIVPEVFVIVVSVGIALYLLKLVLLARSWSIKSMGEALENAHVELQKWQARTQTLRSGLTEAITQQLIEWKLTPAEQEVTFLLIKGLSIREIAEVRQTTERTTRQHASEIYRKSGLAGRAQLSAFFLEDLFTPVTDN